MSELEAEKCSKILKYFQKMSDRDSSPENVFMKGTKGLKSQKPKPEQKDLEEAVPAHILRYLFEIIDMT